MFEYEVMAKTRMRDFHRQAASDHRAYLAASDQKTAKVEVGRILVLIGRTFVAACRFIARRPQHSAMPSSGIAAGVSNELPGR